jgi:hypothetical protein
MAIDFIPKIRPENYPIFLGIPANDFPKTFKEWERMMLQKKDDFLLRWGTSDPSITNVEINPGEFIEYCRTTKPKSTLEAILRLALEKGMGQRN